MSYDASSLRGCLQRIDGSAPTIQGAAKAMMKHYDKSPQVAVNCWRDMLVGGSTRSDQFLPLLYVANEVLQNSKRNRGNRFLEAFSPVLGQSLAYVCGKSPPPVVESIRRTVKIWAERRVFSIRYVNELLKGLEAYRNNGSGSGSGKGSNSGRDSSSGRKGDADAYPETSMGSPGGSRFSPGPESPQEQDNNDDDDDNLFGDGPSTAASNNNNKTIDSMDESDNDHDHDNSDNDSIDDLFGNATTTTKRLQVDVDFDRAASLSSSLQQPNSSKRKRNSGGSGSGNNQRNSNSNNNNNNNNSNKNSNKHKHNNKPGKRRNSAKQYLSATSLLDLMQQVSGLGHEAVVSELGDLRRAYAHDSDNDNDNSDGNSKNNNSSSSNNNNNKDIESLVGHELLAAYRTTLKEEAKLANCRKRLRSIAETKRGLELEAFRYLPWLERALKQDADDLELFGATYRNQLLAFARVHEPTKNARDRRLAAEALRLEREREKQNRKREEEERKKFMESAMSKQTEAQPGMVWNRATGEYQHLNQEESWRD